MTRINWYANPSPSYHFPSLPYDLTTAAAATTPTHATLAAASSHPMRLRWTSVLPRAHRIWSLEQRIWSTGVIWGSSSFVVDSEMMKKAPKWWSHGECPASVWIHLDATKGARWRCSNPRCCRSVWCRDGSLSWSRALIAPPPGLSVLLDPSRRQQASSSHGCAKRPAHADGS